MEYQFPLPSLSEQMSALWQDHYTFVYTFASLSIAFLSIVLLSNFFSSVVGKGKSKKKLPPGPKGIPVLGNIFDVDPLQIQDSVGEMHKQYGPIVYYHFGPMQFVSVKDPEIVKEIVTHKERKDIFSSSRLLQQLLGHHFPNGLMAVTGGEWRFHRSILQLTMQGQKAFNVLPALNRICKDACGKIDGTMGKPFELHDILSRILLDAFGHFGYAHNFDSVNGHSEDELWAAKEISANIPLRLQQPLKMLWYLPTKMNRKIWRAQNIIKNFAEKLILRRMKVLEEMEREARAHHESVKEFKFAFPQPTNMVDAMLQTYYKEDGRKMTLPEIRDDLCQILFAAFDTTSNTLSFTLDFLAKHPQVQEKLFVALKELEDENGEINEKDLVECEYLDFVLKESMRLLPTAYGVARTVTKEVEIAGYTIPKNTEILLNNFEMGRASSLWRANEDFSGEAQKDSNTGVDFSREDTNTAPVPAKEADDILMYRPERWGEESFRHNRFALMPFGVGSHMCIGHKTALLEMKAILSSFVRRYEIGTVSDKPMKFVIRLALSPESAWFTMRRRREQGKPRRKSMLPYNISNIFARATPEAAEDAGGEGGGLVSSADASSFTLNSSVAA